MNYYQQTKHPNWQRKRLEVLELNDFQCQVCGETETELHVHHPFYRRGAQLWEYENNELQCLCKECHIEAHAEDAAIKREVGILAPGMKKVVFGLAQTINSVLSGTGNDPLRTDNPQIIMGVALAYFFINGRNDSFDAFKKRITSDSTTYKELDNIWVSIARGDK